MRYQVGSALVIGILFSSVALGARDRDVDRALRKEYPDAKTEVTNVRTINGVKVYDVRVTDRQGDCYAKVTEYGDFVLTGLPRTRNNISRPAMETLNGLFRGGQSDVDVYHVTDYVVDVRTDHKTFRLYFDPVGWLHDIANEAEIRKDDVKTMEKVNDKSRSLKADDYAKKYMEGDKIDGVYRAPEADDFFVVDLRQRDGKDARITVNNDGRVYSEREQIDANDLPKPVQAALDQMFDRTRIQRVYRSEYEYYQFDKITNGGDHTTVRIRPNGDVLSVTGEGVARADADSKHKDFK